MSAAAIERLARALEFLDACRAQAGAVEVGAMRDAHEMLDDAARDAVDELRDPVAAYCLDRLRHQPDDAAVERYPQLAPIKSYQPPAGYILIAEDAMRELIGDERYKQLISTCVVPLSR